MRPDWRPKLSARESLLLAGGAMASCLLETAILEAPTAVGMFRRPSAIDAQWLSSHALFSVTCLIYLPGYVAAGGGALLNRRSRVGTAIWGACASLFWHLALASRAHFAWIVPPDFVVTLVAPALIGAAFAGVMRYALVASSM